MSLYLVSPITPEMEFDLDKALEDVPVHVEDTSSRTPPTPSQALPKLDHRSTGAMAELPSEEEKKLQHYTKLRPRRNKKTHSSKVPVSDAWHTQRNGRLVGVKWSRLGIRVFNFLFQQISNAPSQDGEQNGLMGRVDEGVDEFFSTKVTKMDSK